MNKLLHIASRVLLAQIFIIAGFGKIGGYAGTQGYMEAMGVPGVLLPLVIILELGGGIALVLGYQTRIVAFLLAGFCLLTALIFHNFLADSTQMVMFMKNLAIAGGLLLLVQHGATEPSLDGRQQP